jgi:predicted KAP-like P-loop ATPase
MSKARKRATTQGYDAPPDEDELGRQPLARAIADIVAGTPPEFGVRVGLFGEWGSGKSSVLNFVQRLLEVREHFVVRFSPWGLSDPADVWSKLGRDLIDQLGENRGSRFARAKFKYTMEIKQGVQAVKVAAPNLGLPYGQKVVGAVAGPALDWFERVLSVTGDQLAKLANPGERIVVMIDDVDRTEAKRRAERVRQSHFGARSPNQ